MCCNTVDDTEIEMDIVKYDFTKFPGLDNVENLTDALVMYNGGKNVTVDTRASDEYVLWAATHEMICVGPYKHLAPKAEQECCQCGEIDLMLLELMPEGFRQDYRAKRLEMFRTLIDLQLYESDEMRETFEHSIALLS